MVNQCWIGSPPPCWVRQNRSISTTHWGRSLAAERSNPSRSDWYSRKAAVTSLSPSGATNWKLRNSFATAGSMMVIDFSYWTSPSRRPRWICSAVSVARAVAAWRSTTVSPSLSRRARVWP